MSSLVFLKGKDKGKTIKLKAWDCLSILDLQIVALPTAGNLSANQNGDQRISRYKN